MRKNYLKNREGQVVILAAIIMVGIIALMGLIIDVGFLYSERAKIQTACDAAALAGALKLPDTYQADITAKYYAELNGFKDGTDGVVVTTVLNPDGMHPDWFRVIIQKPVKHFFMPVIGYKSTTVSAFATARHISLQPINIWGTGTYGTAGTQSLEISGPYGYDYYGDPYSTIYTGSGYTKNPKYNPGGYNFWLNIPSNYFTKNGTYQVKLEIYDATSGSSQDENYYAHGCNKYATTVYSIYAPDNTPSDYSDDVLIATVTVPPNSATYKLKWVCPPGFQFNYSLYGPGNYRINVRTTDGSGGNAFHLRAGPPTSTFNPNNGTSISAVGSLQMFFLNNGTVNTALGYIPPEAAGMKIHITKFDTDIGATSIIYTDSTGMINWQGTLSSNGTWKEDVYTIPENYPGGVLFANYTAGKNDTSVWEMWYEGTIPGQAAKVKLVE